MNYFLVLDRAQHSLSLNFQISLEACILILVQEVSPTQLGLKFWCRLVVLTYVFLFFRKHVPVLTLAGSWNNVCVHRCINLIYF